MDSEENICSPVTINLPLAAREKIYNIVQAEEIFEDSHDFILHAITDLLEEYRRKK